MIDGRKVLLGHLTILDHKDGGFTVPRCKGYRKGNCSCLADDLGGKACGQLEATIDQAKASIAEVEHGIGCHVHSSWFIRVGSRSYRHRWMTVDGAAEVDGVATNVHQSTTS